MSNETGHRVAQIRAIFSLREQDAAFVFHEDQPTPMYLAYVEWFTPFGQANPVHGMFKIQRLPRDDDHSVSVIPLTRIRRSIHLYPDFGASAPPSWTSANVLEDCPRFWVNPFTDRHAHSIIV